MVDSMQYTHSRATCSTARRTNCSTFLVGHTSGFCMHRSTGALQHAVQCLYAHPWPFVFHAGIYSAAARRPSCSCSCGRHVQHCGCPYASCMWSRRGCGLEVTCTCTPGRHRVSMCTFVGIIGLHARCAWLFISMQYICTGSHACLLKRLCQPPRCMCCWGLYWSACQWQVHARLPSLPCGMCRPAICMQSGRSSGSSSTHAPANPPLRLPDAAGIVVLFDHVHVSG